MYLEYASSTAPEVIERATLKMRDEIAGHENARNAIVWNTACCIGLSIAEQDVDFQLLTFFLHLHKLCCQLCCQLCCTDYIFIIRFSVQC